MELKLDTKKTILELQEGDIVTYKGRACMVVWLASIGVMEDVGLVSLTGGDAGKLIANTFRFADIAKDCTELLIKSNDVVITSKGALK